MVPGHGMTRCQYESTGTGWCLQPVPNDHGVKGTGSWHHPVPIVQIKAPGDATTQCQPVLGLLQVAVNSLFMAAKWEQGRRIFANFLVRLVFFLHDLEINF